MANQTYPFFQLNYIDYLGRLRYLQVQLLINKTGQFYICTIDGQDTRIIWQCKDQRWYDLEEGPTVLADELGSIIEGRVVG